MKRRCRACLQLVGIYQPASTRVLRAELHNSPGPISRQVCPGSYGPTDEPERAAREDAATRRWAATHTGNLADYLREKGET